ncbi:MAG: ABC-F family ATP-binding cassette domain-containing protein [Verrucomicrobiota bacterium]
MLTIRKMTKAVGGRTLFQNADFTLNWGERFALVGPNGAGKSTLFRMILGQDQADEGEIERDEYALTGSLEQEAGDAGDESILEIAMGINPEMAKLLRIIHRHEKAGTTGDPEFAQAQDEFDAQNGYQLEPKAKRMLGGLGFQQGDFDRPAAEFSGGWVMRAYLARLLVLEPDLLMLDEPTNHLDLMTLLWFQRHLQNYGGAILVISHDRDFMNAVAENIVEIDEQQLIPYQGDYSAYEEQREARYEQKVKAYRNQQKEIERVQEFIDQFRSVSSKASQVQSRVKQLEKMDKLPKPIATRKVFKFNFPQPQRSNQKVIELRGLHQAYGDKKIYQGLDLVVERGERTALVGPNGAGKSTLIKLLAGALAFQKGERECGYLTKIGYFSQHRSENLQDNNTVLEEVIASNAEMREDEIRSVLGSFLFRRADVHKKIRVLSGGEKSRLNLVKFLVDPPNLLLMDEPTTHLDILSVDALVQALKAYQGTLLFISHDVHFIRSLADHVLHINEGQVTRYVGGYDYFLEKSGLNDDRSAVTAG